MIGDVPVDSIIQNFCKSYSVVSSTLVWRVAVEESDMCGMGPESKYPIFDFTAVGPLPRMM